VDENSRPSNERLAMPTPTPVGRIHYDEPRGVLVRDPEEESGKHSAVHGGINVYVESISQATHIMNIWPMLMAELSDKIEHALKNLEIKE
jgi:hypothetical protein